MHTLLKQFFPTQVFILCGNAASAAELVAQAQQLDGLVYANTVSTFSLGDAQELVAKNSERTEKPLYMICAFDTITPEAHQSLLKTLEEPGGEKYFCFITPRPLLLPLTFRSRAQIVSVTSFTDSDSNAKKSFARATAEAQALYLKKHFSGDEEAGTRKQEGLRLLDELEYSYKDHPEQNYPLLSAIYSAKQMILKGNLVPKQVLEYVVTAMHQGTYML